jgi:diguanylate cyclase (GGDEF)-like protein
MGTVRPVFDAMLDAYFAKRDLAASLEVAGDGVRALGPWASEAVRNKDELARLLTDEFEAYPKPLEYVVVGYVEWGLVPGIIQCGASVMVTRSDSSKVVPHPILLRMTATFRLVDGTWKLTLIHASIPEESKSAGARSSLADVHIHAIEQLRYEATTDALTGILNRRETTRLIDAASGDAEGMLLIVDVDDFKNINDRFGHQAGDAALVALARGIKENVRADDVVGRLGGDEFVVYFARLVNRDVVRAKVQQFSDAFGQAMFDITPGLLVTLSVGVAQRVAGESFDDLYRRADAALYKAKHSGKATMFFDDEA